MASKSAVNLDTVLISIESDAGKAASNISNLATHLTALKNSVKGGFSNINKLADSLEKLIPALEKLKNVSGNLNAIGEITKGLSQLKDVKSPTGLKNTIDSLEKLPEIMGKMDTKTFENLTRVSNELAQSLAPVAEKMQQVAQGYSAFSKIQNTFGKSASTSVKYSKQHKSVLSSLYPLVKRIGSGFTSLSKGIASAFGKGAYANMKKFHSQAKQIFLSLLGTRTLFTMLRKAAAEYQAFDDDLQEFSQNVWRAFGAQLAPALYLAMDLFKQFVRVIYSVVLALTGIDLIARANAKAMERWAKSSKDTLGNLQKFDDLNVVEFPKDDGTDNKLIDLEAIDLSPIQKVIDWVRKLKEEIKEAWNSGEWYGVGEVLAEGINAGIATTLSNIDLIRDKFFEIGRDFGDFLNGIIQNTQWENVGKFITEALKLIPDFLSETLSSIEWDDLGKGINNFFKGFDAIEIINSIGRAIVTGLNGIGVILAQQNWSELGHTLGEVVKTVFNGIADFLKNIPWETVGENLRQAVLSIDWKGVWDSIVNLATSALKGIGDFLKGLFDIDGSDVLKTVGIIGALVAVFLLLKKVISGFGSNEKTINKTTKSFGTMFESFGKAAGTIALLGGMALVINQIVGLIKAFGETGMSATDGLILLGGTLAILAGSFAAIAASTKLIDWQGIAGGVVILGGMALIIHELSGLLSIFNDTGMSLGEGLGFLGGVLAIVVVAMGAMAAISKVLASDPLVLIGVLALVGAISAILLVLKETLPTILNACGKFIDTVAPYLIQLMTTIGDIINDIIRSLGDILPPVINSVGNLFTSIFNGIASVINTVGSIIVRIMNTAASLVDKVLVSILNFINNLGPAINTFVDNAIIAITKLINFVVSAVEYLINTAIIKPINKLINKINNNAIAEKLGWQISTLGTVNIDRFAPKLETGTNEIPYEGIYHLHPGEAVVPKKYNPALGNGGSEEMNQKLDTLIAIMDNMNFTNVVNIGNKKVYEGQQAYNKMQQNKYGTINLY